MDPLTLISPGIAALSLAFGVFQGLRSYRLSRRIAQNQGQLGSPDIELQFNGESLQRDFLIIAPIKPDQIIDFPLSLALYNRGTKTAREIDLTLRFPKPLFYGGTPLSNYTVETLDDHQILRSISSSEHLETMFISIPALNPGVLAGLVGSLSIHAGTLSDNVPVQRLRSDVNKIPWPTWYQWIINIGVTQLDRPAASHSIRIAVLALQDNSFSATLRQFNENLKHSNLKKRLSGSATSIVFPISEDMLEPHPTLADHHVVRLKRLRSAGGFTSPGGFFFPALQAEPRPRSLFAKGYILR